MKITVILSLTTIMGIATATTTVTGGTDSNRPYTVTPDSQGDSTSCLHPFSNILRAHVSFPAEFLHTLNYAADRSDSTIEKESILSAMKKGHNEVYGAFGVSVSSASINGDAVDSFNDTNPGAANNTATEWSVLLSVRHCLPSRPSNSNASTNNEDASTNWTAFDMHNEEDKTILHHEWERVVCATLRSDHPGGLRAGQATHNCTINITNEKNTEVLSAQYFPAKHHNTNAVGVEEETVTEVHLEYGFTVHESRPLSMAEEAFVANAVVEAYNLLHDPQKEAMLSLRVEHESGQQVDVLRGGNRDDENLDFVYGFYIWFSLGTVNHCLFCRDDDGDRILSDPGSHRRSVLESVQKKEQQEQKGTTPLEATMKASTMSPTLQSYWQDTWCSLLRQGPFEIFSQVDSCSIRFATAVLDSKRTDGTVQSSSLHLGESSSGGNDAIRTNSTIVTTTTTTTQVFETVQITLSFDKKAVHQGNDTVRENRPPQVLDDHLQIFIANSAVVAFNEMDDTVEAKATRTIFNHQTIARGGLRGTHDSVAAIVVESVIQLETTPSFDGINSVMAVSWAASMCTNLKAMPLGVLSRLHSCDISVTTNGRVGKSSVVTTK